MSHLQLTSEAGEELAVVPITCHGGTVRVAVGEVGCPSSVWRTWSNRNKNDAYVSFRTIVRVQKCSLHGSGKWRYAFAEQASDDWLPDGAIEEWDRPNASRAGWVAALRISVRAEDVTEVPDDDTDRTRSSSCHLKQRATSGTSF